MSASPGTFTDLGYVPEIGFTYENVFGGQGPNYTQYSNLFDPRVLRSYPVPDFVDYGVDFANTLNV